MYLPLTPEEWVRQQVVHYLHHHWGISLERMNEEVVIPHSSKRADLLVFDSETGGVFLLVECKHPESQLEMAHLLQLVDYASRLQPQYLWLTNFFQNYIWDFRTRKMRSPSEMFKGKKE
jgi:hypothetical protein